MARPLRIQFPGAWYHVMNRGRRGERVFLNKKDYEKFLALLEYLVEVYKIRAVAYCLMSNHYHILIQTPDANLSRAMRHLNGVYAQQFNRTHSFDGPLFRGRYKSILVDADTYLLGLVRYIHRNPLEAGLVKTLDDYPWSSHKAYLSSARKWNWLDKDVVLSLFSSNTRAGATKEYLEYVSGETSQDVGEELGKGPLPSVLGGKEFVNAIKEKFLNSKVFEDVPESRGLAPDMDRIKNVVCRFYEVDRDELDRSRRGQYNEPRNLAIYLARRMRSDTLKEIGEEFGLGKFSSVSSVIQRVKGQIRHDKTVRNRVEDLITQLRKSQEQT